MKFDLVIIGSGTAATSAAFRALKDGWRIAVVDQKPIGGTCALRGCDPKKVIYGVTSALESARRLHGSGIEGLDAEIDWGSLIEFKSTFTEPMSKAIESSLRKSGVELFRGRAAFTGRNSLEVGGQVLEAGKILIASGVRAGNPGFRGAEHLVDNEEFMNMQRLPKRIAFVGGGYISVEFAGIARNAGSRATIIQRGDRILKDFDRDAVDALSRGLADSGIEVITGASVEAVEKVGSAYEVHLSGSAGEETLTVDLVVHGAGREFDPGMGLDLAGVEWSRRGVRVNEYLQSVSNPLVYSAGDSADTPGKKLTPVATMEGEVAAENMVHGNYTRVDYAGVPTTVFASPPLAMAGITEQEARSGGMDVEVRKGDMSSWYNSRRRRIGNSYYKIVLERNSGKILGASILGENAEEVINIFALAIRNNMGADALSSMPYAYPSDSNDIRYMLA